MQGLAQRIDRINGWLGRLVAWCALAMVLAQVLVILLRNLLGMGSIPLQESVWYFHGLLFMLGAGYVLLQDGHVRIDILYRGVKPKTQAAINAFGVIVLLYPFCLAVVFYALPYVLASWRVSEGSNEASGLPLIYAFKTVIPIAFLLLALQGTALLLRCLVTLQNDAPQELK